MNADEMRSMSDLQANLKQFSQLVDEKMRDVGEHRRIVRSLARMSKIGEEAGELHAAMLRNLSLNVLKEDGTVDNESVRGHILSLAVTVLAFYEHWTGNQGDTLSDLEQHMARSLKWAEKQVGES
jgi:hypothetical protein